MPYPFPSVHSIAYGQDVYGYWQALNLFGQKVRFRWIEPGDFLMGSPLDERGRYDWEQQHRVTLTHGYWLAETSCTQALWMAVTGENPSRISGEELPVENVSWDDIDQVFLPPLREVLEDLQPRLPTEAQWEYACRAGTVSAFSFGDDLSQGLANFNGKWNFRDESNNSPRGQMASVYEYQPNQWGLYQMHGNVYEWCADRFEEFDERSLVNPIGPVQGQGRVLRGGSWLTDGRDLRSAFRFHRQPGGRNLNIGFRLAQVPGEPVARSAE